jgi:carbamoyl-phosphate synthase large subunit
MMASRELKIAVSGINDTDNPGPGIGVARSLKEADASITTIGLSYDIQDPGNYMDFVIDKSYILPYPNKGWAAIALHLNKIKERSGLDMIIPNLDAELPLYIKHQEDLAGEGIMTLLPTQAQFDLRAKEHLESVSKNLGIRYPKTYKVLNMDELKQALKATDFPAVVKGNYYKAYVVYNLPDAVLHFTQIADEWGYPILVQELVKGDELNVVGVGDGRGGTLGLVAAKKMTTTALGKFWNGVSIGHKTLLDIAEKFVRQTSWRGPFELECMADGDNIYMIEINPRFPAWVYFATALGVNLPQRLVDFAQGKEVDRSSGYAAGKMMIRYTYEMTADVSDLSHLATQGESRG